MIRHLWYPVPLDLRYVGGDEFTLLAAYSVGWQDGNGKYNTIIVPKDFKTDLSSIPQAARSLIPGIGEHIGPSVIHDWCYRNHWRSRVESDDLFLEGMKAVGIGWLVRNTMWSAVRAGGWVPWNSHVCPAGPASSGADTTGQPLDREVSS